MPQHHTLAAAVDDQPRLPDPLRDDALAESVSATSLSFVACGAAVADLGELLRDLRLALQVAEPRPPGSEQNRAAMTLAVRLEAVRWALDGATAAIGDLLEDCCPSGKSNIRGVIEK